jgi:hypothetical protein
VKNAPRARCVQRTTCGLIVILCAASAQGKPRRPKPAPSLATPNAAATAAIAPETIDIESGSAERRFQLAFRTGFGIPLGSYAKVLELGGFRQMRVNQLADDTYGAIPLWLDVGYRLTPHVTVGAYGMFGVVLPKRADDNDLLGGGCPEGVDCSAYGARFGVQASYAFLPRGSANPWLGIGLGYEWITSHIQGEPLGFRIDSQTSYGGFELLQLQGGVDFRLTERFAAGPYVSASALTYQSCSAELDGAEAPCEIARAAWHGWLVFGARVSVEL